MALFPAYQSEDQNDGKVLTLYLDGSEQESSLNKNKDYLSSIEGTFSNKREEAKEQKILPHDRYSITGLKRLVEDEEICFKSERKKHKSDRKKKSKKKHKKKCSTSDYDESLCHRKEKNENIFNIPIDDGRNKDLFLKIPARSAKPEDIIYFDRYPDKNIPIFSNTHFLQVANYSKMSNIILGEDMILKRKSSKKRRYFSSKSQLNLDSNLSINLMKVKYDKEYIPLNLSYHEEKTNENMAKSVSVNNLGILDSSTEAYIQGKSCKSDASNASHTNINPEKDYWQNRNKTYNEKLNSEPQNIQLWLEFVNFQDEAIPHIFFVETDGGKKKKATCKLLNERKISLLDSAITKNIRSLQLNLERLYLGQNIWPESRLKLEWDKLVTNFPNNPDVWFHYLVFHQTYFPLFHITKVVQFYAKCNERLIQMEQGTFLSHQAPENVGFILIDVAIQLAYVWHQGGYMERSIALFQALIEFNLFSPLYFQKNEIAVSSKLDLFEAFWDSKAPRFGEIDSIGWAKFMEKREPVKFQEEIYEGKRDEEDEILLKGGSKHVLWHCLELSRERHHWYPWQQDPEDCEDPDRMVSFSVIRKHLFVISKEEEVFYLSLNFLMFLGVSIPSRVSQKSHNYDTSKFSHLRLESLKGFQLNEHNFQKSQFDFSVMGPSLLNSSSQSYFEFLLRVVYRFIEVFSNLWKCKMVIILIRILTDRCAVLKRDDVQDINYLKQYKEKIKSLLQIPECRSDAEIYLEYARFEAIVGRRKDVIKVHSASLALVLQGTFSGISSEDIQEVFWMHFVSMICTKIEYEKFGHMNSNEIVNLINFFLLEKKCIFTTEVPSCSLALRAKRKINSLIEINVNKLLSLEFCTVLKTGHFIFILSILQLLTSGFKSACLVYENILEKFNKKLLKSEKGREEMQAKERYFLEYLFEYYIWVIKMSPKLDILAVLPMAPSALREILNSAIIVAPRNVTFLRISMEYQNWRDLLSGTYFCYQDHNYLLSMIFNLLPHMKKFNQFMESADGGNFGTGYQLEAIVDSIVSRCGQNCPLLWRIYLRLIQIIKPLNIKEIVFRALNSCPNAKCIYLDCIKIVPEIMNNILKLMEEKGIRIRLPLEELNLLLEEENEMIESTAVSLGASENYDT